MIRRDPNITKVELAASALGPLRERVVFVGGCAVGLLITDTAASPVRVTFDVDLVVSVSALAAYHGMEKELARLGFKRDMSPDAPICRWRYRELEVDLMPADPNILGFSNRWYPLALATATEFRLPGGSDIRLIAAPVFLGTKFEAHAAAEAAICLPAMTWRISSTSWMADPRCWRRSQLLRKSYARTCESSVLSCSPLRTSRTIYLG